MACKEELLLARRHRMLSPQLWAENNQRNTGKFSICKSGNQGRASCGKHRCQTFCACATIYRTSSFYVIWRYYKDILFWSFQNSELIDSSVNSLCVFGTIAYLVHVETQKGWCTANTIVLSNISFQLALINYRYSPYQAGWDNLLQDANKPCISDLPTTGNKQCECIPIFAWCEQTCNNTDTDM